MWNFELFSILLRVPKHRSLKQKPSVALNPQYCSCKGGFLALFCVSSREGRAALVASFAVVKYLTLYGMIQFIGTALLFWVSVLCPSFISMLCAL